MAVKLWVASGAGNASTAGNWFPSGSPGALDIARFALNANNCNWDIASVNAISIEATYTGEITFATNVSIASSFTLEAENCITAGSAKSLTFTGTAFYNTNQTYVKNNCTDPFVNAAGRANLEYIFTGNGSTPVLLDTGKYPHVRYNGSKFSPKYVSNTLSTNANKISMQSFTYATFSSVGHETPTQNDRDLRWEIDGQYNSSADNSFHIPFTNNVESFDGGYGTWDFQAGFRFPTSSSNIYGNHQTVGLIFTWRNVELSNRAGLTNPKTELDGTLYIDNLTVNSGIWFGNRPNQGATLLTINRPKIRGTLGLKQVADGMYISGTPNLDVAYGGTGLNMVINGRIPYGDSVQKLATSSTFTFSGGLLSAGNGITLNPISSQPSVSNTLWLNSLASNALYLDGSAVGGGGGGGGMTSFTLAGSSGSSQTITNGNTLTIAQGTGITSVAGTGDTVTITNTGVTSNVAGAGIGVSGATGAVTVSNTGVTSNVAGTGITVSGATGAVTIGCDLEGTELKSTGETGGSKFLREDGDGTCSWQTVSGGGGGGATAFTGLTDTPANYVGSAFKTVTVNASANALEFTTPALPIGIFNAGTYIGSPTKIDFTGAGVTATFAGTTATVDIPSGGGGGGQPLFKHDQNPTSSNFNPHRLLVHGDTIEVGNTSGSGKNVDVFTPAITSDGGNRMITINATGAAATNTGREYIFFGQFGDRSTGDPVVYQFDNSGGSLTVPHFFIHHMSQVKLPATVPNFSFIVTHQLRINKMSHGSSFTPPNAVRVIDAGEFSLLNPSLDEENPITHRLFLVTDIPYDFQARVITAVLGKTFS